MVATDAQAKRVLKLVDEFYCVEEEEALDVKNAQLKLLLQARLTMQNTQNKNSISTVAA